MECNCPVTAFSPHSKTLNCASGTSHGAIDNRIEQAMDLVKSHLMNAVRSEVEELKEKIVKLEDCNPKMSSLDHTLLKKFWFKFRKIRKYRRMRHLNNNSKIPNNNKPNRKRNPRKINNSNRPHNIR